MHELWTSRHFAFDAPVDRLPVFLSRLRGTLDRLEVSLRGVPQEILAARQGSGWSILDNIGHLFDLDELHDIRLSQLEAGESELRAGDIENKATWAANHHASTLASLMSRFRTRRDALIRRLREWPREGLTTSAIHPRLKQPMRVVDVASFTAEHDDYHLARIDAILESTIAAKHSKAIAAPWLDLPVDSPMPLLERRRIIGEMAMISHITLHKGCVVPVHHHANEQFSAVLRGFLRFTLADRVCDVRGGEVIHFPANAPHGAEAIEETEVLDVFAPPSAGTGIDRPSRRG